VFRYSPTGALKGTYFRAESLPPTILEGAALFDGRTWIEDAAIVVENGTVTALGPRNNVARPRDARAIPLEGRWLMPGLIDCRSFPVGRPPDEVARPQSARFKTSGPILAHRGVQDAHRMLSGGIIGLAQLGGGDVEYVAGLRDAVRTALIAAPTILNAGLPLSPVAGGIEAWHEPGDDPDRRLPGTGMMRRPSRHTARVAGTPDGMRKAIRRSFVDGADMVMLLLTGPEPSEQLAMSDRELAAAAHEAQRVGARVACQATGNLPSKAALRAGVDLLILGPDEPDEELVAMLRTGRTAWAPSLAGRPGGATKRLRAAVKEVGTRGGRVVVGTGWRREAPVAFAAEIAALLSAGLPVGTVLEATSTGGAAALGLANGPLALGERANLVAFDFDPRSAPDALGEAGRASFILHVVPGRRLTPLQSILGVKAAS